MLKKLKSIINEAINENPKINRIDQRLESLEQRQEVFEQKLESFGQKLDSFEHRQGVFEQKLESFGQQQESFGSDLKSLNTEVAQILIRQEKRDADIQLILENLALNIDDSVRARLYGNQIRTLEDRTEILREILRAHIRDRKMHLVS